MQRFYKRSAVHNLVIDETSGSRQSNINEGLAVPPSLLKRWDIVPWERIILARIGSDNWTNRVTSFIVENDSPRVEARGSLAHFVTPGDIVCLITQTLLTDELRSLHSGDRLTVVDYGLTPESNSNPSLGTIIYEYSSYNRSEEDGPLENSIEREKLPRVLVDSLVLGLAVNVTHPSCLHGSAEIPKPVMLAAGLTRHQIVEVFNVTSGGVAETYVHPMEPGVVMTTGAMSNFAPIGSCVNIVSYVISVIGRTPRIILTDGKQSLPPFSHDVP